MCFRRTPYLAVGLLLHWASVIGQTEPEQDLPHVHENVVLIPRAKQFELLQAKEQECYEKMASEPPPTEGAYCNRTWDGLFCWPNTPVGTTTIQSCPNYINMFDVRENASRECLQNGSWFYHPVYNGTWSNYTQCN
ncbi:calcitonin gene-related peptide type 1 receptor-like [Lingula anatina]|uniref:Calcitonin gene-related peptide type 1 receptor-like n=1 Tax=Lingula anatina TaxID=7574 RepID=A0A2R2MLK5_LINAN|nr:calcitonin gene-related peptide type 1 receptor-like [Lingula anatina]|eukprot:XP_023931103.1 calcitonin gene-related peptide type 1 receptor-like [Lingula anatina]